MSDSEVFGVEVDDLETDSMPVDVIVMVKALDREGTPTIYSRTSRGLNDFEKIGILFIELFRTTTMLLDSYIPEDDPDGD